MVATLVAPKPAVRGRSTPLRRIGLHLIGLLLTGIPTGALLGALLPNVPFALPIWAIVAAAYGLHEMRLITLPHPQRMRQVPAGWRRKYQPRVVAFAYGLLIGPGYLIFIRTTAFYLLTLGTLLAGSPLLGAIGWALVALGRTVPSLLAVWNRAGLDAHLARTMALDNPARIAGGVLLAALASGAVTSLFF